MQQYSSPNFSNTRRAPVSVSQFPKRELFEGPLKAEAVENSSVMFEGTIFERPKRPLPSPARTQTVVLNQNTPVVPPRANREQNGEKIYVQLPPGFFSPQMERRPTAPLTRKAETPVLQRKGSAPLPPRAALTPNLPRRAAPQPPVKTVQNCVQAPAGVEPAEIQSPTSPKMEIRSPKSPKMSRLIRSPQMLRKFLSPPPQRPHAEVEQVSTPTLWRKAVKPEKKKCLTPQPARKGKAELGFTNPSKFKPNQKQKVEGSHKSIGLPTTFVHCTHNTNIVQGDLELLYGPGQWVKHWFILDHCHLSWKSCTFGEVKLPIHGCTIESVSTAAHPFVLVISPLKGDPITVAAATREEISHWIKSFRSNGATYRESDAFKLEEKKARENPAAKAEEEYIKSKEKIFADRAAKLQQSAGERADPVNCHCRLNVVKGAIVEGKLRYQIDINWDKQKWTVYRLESQISDLKKQLRSRVNLELEQLPKKATVDVLVPIQNRRFNVILQHRNAIFADSKASTSFVRFIAPIQYGDEKGADFLMPFEKELILPKQQPFRRF